MKLNINRSKKLMLCAFSLIAVTVSIPSAQAGHAGAFLGGIAVAKIGQSVRDRNDYEEDQAYYAQQQAQAANSKPSTEQQLAKLQDLAEKGYITPEEYKAKKKAILDAM